jgi:hypothetical protein
MFLTDDLLHPFIYSSICGVLNFFAFKKRGGKLGAKLEEVKAASYTLGGDWESSKLMLIYSLFIGADKARAKGGCMVLKRVDKLKYMVTTRQR